MSDFNPDEYLKAKAQPPQGEASSSEFDPDKYLASKSQKEPTPQQVQTRQAQQKAIDFAKEWGGAIVDAFTKGIHPEASEMSVASSPLLMASSPATAVPAATAGAVQSVVGAIGRKLPEIAKTAGPVVAGEVYDRIAGGHQGATSGAGLSILRHLIRRGILK